MRGHRHLELGSVLLAVTPVHALASDEDFRSYLDQARFFLRKEWYADAREQLEKAVSTQDGKLDPEAWFLLAKVRFELGDLPGARYAADRALVHSRDQDQARQTHELLLFFEQKFGYVTVEAPRDGVSAALDVELQSTIFDPDLKRWVNKLVEVLKEPVALPHELGLPAAQYTINGLEVEVTPGSHQSISPKLDHSNSGSMGGIMLELGLGASGLMGQHVANLHPAPTTDLGVRLPLGPLEVGALGAWSVQGYSTRDGGSQRSLFAWSLGARVGAGLPLPGVPLDLRPSATWRVLNVPGVEVGCSRIGGADAESWACDRDGAHRDLYVYTAALAQAFGLEAAVSTRQRIGLGVRAAGEVVVGSLPHTGTAIGPDGALEFAVDGARGVGGGSWRMLATVACSL